MSEFECACGEPIMPSIGYCTLCGGKPVRMDGMTAFWYAKSEAKDISPDNEDKED